MFTVKELCQKANISQPTFYRLVRDSEEFRSLTEQNRIKKGNGYRYDTPVLEYLTEIYSHDTGVNASDTDQIEQLRADLVTKEAELAQLRADLVTKEAERLQLFAANQQLLLLLSQEKAEKQLLLPKPRKPLIERIGEFFKAKDKPNSL